MTLRKIAELHPHPFRFRKARSMEEISRGWRPKDDNLARESQEFIRECAKRGEGWARLLLRNQAAIKLVNRNDSIVQEVIDRLPLPRSMSICARHATMDTDFGG